MGIEVSQACLRAGLALADTAMTGPGMPAEVVVTHEDQTVTVKLVGPQEPGAQRAMLEEASKKYGDRLFIIDFTHPTAVNPNAELYTATGCAFVMGTTGGDRDILMNSIRERKTWAVIAPNMSKQIVALQATMDNMAKEFPGCFSGWGLDITESHQKTKADTSGTAKAMAASFKTLANNDFSVDNITKLRDDVEQQKFGVPADALTGHAFHTYSLKSEDGSVEFQFKHNVCGRRTYAEGVVDAVLFLAERRKAGSEQRCYNMIDVLKAGAMR